MERCPRCRTKYDPSYTVSCTECGLLLVDLASDPPSGHGTDEPTHALPPAQEPRSRHGLLLGAVGGAVALGVAGVLALLTLATPELDEVEDREPQTIVSEDLVSVLDVRMGDCVAFQSSDEEAGTVNDVLEVPCDAAHPMQVLANVDYGQPGDIFPGDDEIDSFAWEECTSAYQDFVGIAYEDEALFDFTWLDPTPRGWKSGDRGVTCLLTSYDGGDLVGSAEGRGLLHHAAVAVGCYDYPEPELDGRGFYPRDCLGAHDIEVYRVGLYDHGPDDSFDDPALLEHAEEACSAEFDTVTDQPPGDLDWSLYYPSEASWQDGDRGYTCYLYSNEGTPLTDPIANTFPA